MNARECFFVCVGAHNQRSNLSGLRGFARYHVLVFAIRCKTLTDPPRQEKTRTSWETSLAVYRRLSLLNTDNVSASEESRAGDGKGEKEYLAEEILGNKQRGWRRGVWKEAKYER